MKIILVQQRKNLAQIMLSHEEYQPQSVELFSNWVKMNQRINGKMASLVFPIHCIVRIEPDEDSDFLLKENGVTVICEGKNLAGRDNVMSLGENRRGNA